MVCAFAVYRKLFVVINAAQVVINLFPCGLAVSFAKAEGFISCFRDRSLPEWIPLLPPLWLLWHFFYIINSFLSNRGTTLQTFKTLKIPERTAEVVQHSNFQLCSKSGFLLRFVGIYARFTEVVRIKSKFSYTYCMCFLTHICCIFTVICWNILGASPHKQSSRMLSSGLVSS